FVRSHELEIVRARNGRPSLEAKVTHVNPARPVVKVRVYSEAFGVVLTVDVSWERYAELRVALPAHVDGEHHPEGLGVDAHLHHRARRVDVRDLRLEARPAVPRAHDLELVRTDEGRRGARLVVRVVGVGDLQAAEAGPPVLHAAVEDVHVAE